MQFLQEDYPETPEPARAGSPGKLLIISQCALFQGLSQQLMVEVARRAGDLVFPGSAVLFRAGTVARSVYALGSGCVKLSIPTPEGPEALVQLVPPGELLGWCSVLSNEVYRTSARAVGTVRALSWQKQDFDDLLQSIPALSRNGLNMLAHELREQQQRYFQLATEQAPQRVARALLRLTRYKERPDEIPLSRAELAQITGTSLFTVSRMLSLWDSQRIVRARRGRVVVENRAALGRIAEMLPEPSHPAIHALAE